MEVIFHSRQDLGVFLSADAAGLEVNVTDQYGDTCEAPMAVLVEEFVGMLGEAVRANDETAGANGKEVLSLHTDLKRASQQFRAMADRIDTELALYAGAVE